MHTDIVFLLLLLLCFHVPNFVPWKFVPNYYYYVSNCINGIMSNANTFHCGDLDDAVSNCGCVVQLVGSCSKDSMVSRGENGGLGIGPIPTAFSGV